MNYADLLKGLDITGQSEIPPRPGAPAFATEVYFKKDDLFYGKLHVRKSNNAMYLSVISKIPFNWKQLVGDMKFSGTVVDSAGGLLWLKENDKTLENDIAYIEKYLTDMKNKNEKAK
ncbi:succinate dehydrogenase [Ferroplasma sp.]|uniref:succinate dehydrogenase n=1 Tax=Ferroplasma sp. TaxID=2591003 RepID=UPI00307D98FC